MIGEREIHIWIARTDVGDDALRSLAHVLDDEERARVARFHFDADRNRAIVARGALRLLLARELACNAANLRFMSGWHGKPSLPGAELEFNVSHSGDFAIVAIAAGSPIGVDVEWKKPLSDITALAKRFFAPAEAEAILCANEHDARDLFFATWTAKEAVVKAAGGGVSHGLASFRVTPGAAQFEAVENYGSDAQLDGWYVQALPPLADHYSAAVAVRGEGWKTFVRAFES